MTVSHTVLSDESYDETPRLVVSGSSSTAMVVIPASWA